MNKSHHIIILMLLFVCLYAIFAVSFPDIRFLSGFNPDCNEELNKIIQNISFSIVAAVIFYYISVFLPFREKKQVIQYSLLGYITNIRNTSFFFFLDNINQIPHKNDKDGAINVLERKLKANNYIVEGVLYRNLIDYQSKVDNQLDLLIANHDFLSKEDLLKCYKIKGSYSFQIINNEFYNGDGSSYSFSKNGEKRFVESLVDNHLLMEELLCSINKPIYKKNKKREKRQQRNK